MKLLILYLCLLAVMFQAIFASTSSERATFKSKSGGSMAKRRKPQGKRGKASIVSKRGGLNLLIALLLKELVEIVIGYFNNDTYPVLVHTHNWLLQAKPAIAVDSAKLYVITESEGLKGLNHSSASLRENDRRCIEFGDPRWFEYWGLTSSHDGRHVFFTHKYRASKEYGEQIDEGIKWFTQGNKLEDGKHRRVAFGGEHSSWGLLSRDEQVLCSCNIWTKATRVYQIKEEAGKDPTAFMKFEFGGMLRAVSGKGNRVLVANARQLEIYDIGKDAGKLVCQTNSTDYTYKGALNEDGSEAAFVDSDELRIVEVDKVVGDKVEKSAIVTVKVPKSFGLMVKLVYSDKGKLHVLHSEGNVSLFNPSTKKLVPIEAPQKGRNVICSAISPTAAYIATIQRVGKAEKSGMTIYKTIVKRKLKDADLNGLFGYEADKTTSKSPADKQQ